MSRPANPSPWPRPGSPAWSQPATVQRASPRLRRCAKGGGGRTAWRSKRKPCTRSCGHASRRRAKCRARATPQQPEAIPAFQATGQEQLQRALPSTNTRPVRVCSPDERRVGLLTIRRRRLTARGVRPGGSVPQVFAWFYVYGAVEPATGERFFLERPYLQAARFQLSRDPFAQAFADRLPILRVDHRGAQTARRLTLPDNVPLVVLPPYGPELNPSARVWRDRKNALAWLQCPNREAQQDDIAPLLRGDQAATRQALTGYTYLIAAIYALGTERNHIRCASHASRDGTEVCLPKSMVPSACVTTGAKVELLGPQLDFCAYKPLPRCEGWATGPCMVKWGQHTKSLDAVQKGV